MGGIARFERGGAAMGAGLDESKYGGQDHQRRERREGQAADDRAA